MSREKDIMRLAIVGCGDIGGYIAMGCRYNRHIEMIACVDTRSERAEIFAKKNKIEHIYNDYRELFNHDELDAIYLGVPHHLHHDMIVECLEKGYHVFCEKPVTITVDDALDVCGKSLDTGKKVGINYQYRYDHSCFSLIEAGCNGELGEIRYGRCNLPWHRTSDYFTGAPWHAKKTEAGGATLITQASHIMDVCLKAMNSHPVEAWAITEQKVFKDVEVEDFAMGIIKLENGSQLQVASSMIVEPEEKITADIYGSKGRGHYTGGGLSKIKFLGEKVPKRKAPVRWGLKGIHPLLRSIEGFRRWVKYDTPYLVPVEESLAVLAAVDAMYRSAESGSWEKIDDRYRKFLK